MTITRKDFIYIGIMALAVGVWFHPFFLRGEVLLPPNAMSAYPWYGAEANFAEPTPRGSMDAVRENYITWALHDRYIAEGHAPDWNPYILNGNPLLANQFAIPYSPFKLLNIPFSAGVGWSWAIILKSFITALFTYLALRALKLSYTAATIGGIAWMASSPFIHQTQTTYNEGMAMMPVLFFLMLRAYQVVGWRRQALYAVPAALVAGFQFNMGNIQMTIYVFLMLFAFALYWTFFENTGPRWRPLLILIAVYTAGVGVGAVQILPTLELTGLSIRGAAQTHQNKGIEPYTELSFLNPWVYHWRNFEFISVQAQHWLNDRWNPYIGLLPLLAGAIAVRFVRQKFALALMAFSVVMWGTLHLVYWRPIFELVNDLPGYNVLEQTRWLLVLPFPMILLAAYGVDWLLEHGRAQWRKVVPFWVAALGVLGLMALGLGAANRYLWDEIDTVPEFSPRFEAQRTRTGLEILIEYYSFENPLFWMSFVIGGAILLVLGLYLWGKLRRNWLAAALIAIVAVDVVFFASENIGTTPKDELYATTPAIEFLQERMDDEVFRVGDLPNTLIRGRRFGEYSSYRDDHRWFMSSALPVLVPNTAGLFRLQDYRGYESVYTLAYSEYLAAAEGRDDPFGAGAWLWETTTHPMLDRLNVRYILAAETIDDDPTLELVYEGEIFIYENMNALPRARFAASYEILEDDAAILAALADEANPFEGVYFERSPSFELAPEADIAQNRATITRYEPNRVEIAVDAPSEGVLVLADLAYPGWVARVDGEETSIHTADTIFRAIYVPAGAERVEFVYEAPIIRAGEIISLVSLVLLSLAWLWLVISIRKTPSPKRI